MRQWTFPLLGTVAMLALSLSSVSADESAAVADAEFLGATVSDRTLDAQRGGEMYFNEIDEYAELTDNTAVDNVTGANFITDNAFGGASGLPVAVQNTGNNVIIQNSFILNLQMQ